MRIQAQIAADHTPQGIVLETGHLCRPVVRHLRQPVLRVVPVGVVVLVPRQVAGRVVREVRRARQRIGADLLVLVRRVVAVRLGRANSVVKVGPAVAQVVVREELLRRARANRVRLRANARAVAYATSGTSQVCFAGDGSAASDNE